MNITSRADRWRSKQPLLPVLSPVVRAAAPVLSHRGRSRTGGLDEGAHLARILSPRYFDARRDINPPRMDALDRLGDVVGVQSTPEDHPRTRRDPLGEAPVEHSAGAGSRRVNEDGICSVLAGVGNRARTRTKRLDDERHLRRHKGDVLWALVSDELGGAQSGLVDDVDHTLR